MTDAKHPKYQSVLPLLEPSYAQPSPNLPARAASRRNSTRTLALDHGRPRVRPVDDAEQRPEWQLDPGSQPRSKLDSGAAYP